jgi:hypothetical protein
LTSAPGKASPAAALVYELDLRRALEAAGLEFIAENGGGTGVRFESKPE